MLHVLNPFSRFARYSFFSLLAVAAACGNILLCYNIQQQHLEILGFDGLTQSKSFLDPLSTRTSRFSWKAYSDMARMLSSNQK